MEQRVRTVFFVTLSVGIASLVVATLVWNRPAEALLGLAMGWMGLALYFHFETDWKLSAGAALVATAVVAAVAGWNVAVERAFPLAVFLVAPAALVEWRSRIFAAR